MALWGTLPLFRTTSKLFNHCLIALIYSAGLHSWGTRGSAASQESSEPIPYTKRRNGAGSGHGVGHFLTQEEKEGFRSWRHPGPALPRKAGTAGPGSVV